MSIDDTRLQSDANALREADAEIARLRGLLKEAREALDSVDRREGLLQSEHAVLAKLAKEGL